MKVVAIEAGPRLKVSDYPFDEITSATAERVRPVQVELGGPDHEAEPRVAATRPLGATGPMINAVGGTSIHWMTQSWRFLPWNFKIPSESRKRYGPNAIPKDSTSIDWPFDYNELEPYYDKHEYFAGVSGQAGNVQGRSIPAATSTRGRGAARIRFPRCVPPGGRT